METIKKGGGVGWGFNDIQKTEIKAYGGEGSESQALRYKFWDRICKKSSHFSSRSQIFKK